MNCLIKYVNAAAEFNTLRQDSCVLFNLHIIPRSPVACTASYGSVDKQSDGIFFGKTVSWR